MSEKCCIQYDHMSKKDIYKQKKNKKKIFDELGFMAYQHLYVI